MSNTARILAIVALAMPIVGLLVYDIIAVRPHLSQIESILANAHPQDAVPSENAHENSLAEAAQTDAEIVRNAKIRHSIQAFGGAVIGKDVGEWGGEVAFRESDGVTYRLVSENSHGIFDMPFGVVAVTGLAHLDINDGAVHLLSRQPGHRVTARTTLRLPGWPCDVAHVGSTVNMRIFIGSTSAPVDRSRPLYRCYSLRSPTQLAPMQCAAVVPDTCFG